MKTLILRPEDSWKIRPNDQVDLIIDCFQKRGIAASPQQSILLWERISKEVYGVDWVKVPDNPESLWQILQGNRFMWQVEANE